MLPGCALSCRGPIHKHREGAMRRLTGHAEGDLKAADGDGLACHVEEIDHGTFLLLRVRAGREVADRTVCISPRIRCSRL